MISFGAEVRVFVATQPIDFRKGVHGLVALVAEGLGGQPYSGDGHRQLERAMNALAASVRSPSCQKEAILETLRQVANARSREARRKSAVAVSG